MQKPNGYDQVQVDFVPVELGGHHAIIKDVKEQKTKTGKDMIVVAIDFAKNDKQPGYFMDSFEKDIRPDKKWPYQAVQYITILDSQDKTSRSFKSFITCFEKSNGCVAVWGNTFVKQFKNKKIGVVFGNVEEEYNGEIKIRRRIRWFCEDAAVDTAAIPEDRLLQLQSRNRSTTSSNDFVNVPDDADDEIPF